MSRELIIILGLSFGFALFLTMFIFWVRQMRDAVPAECLPGSRDD